MYLAYNVSSYWEHRHERENEFQAFCYMSKFLYAYLGIPKGVYIISETIPAFFASYRERDQRSWSGFFPYDESSVRRYRF